MAVGVGGLIASLTQGDPTAQIANALAGPNPNPQAQAGGAPSPTGAPGQAPGAPGINPPPPQQQMPPAPGYAPDPANAKTIDLLLRVNQREALAQDLNRGLQQVAGGFGTAQQQHDSMEALRGMPQGGGETLGALGHISQLQQEQFKLQNDQRFVAGADMFGQTVLHLKPGEGGFLSSNPQLFQLFTQHVLSAQDPTELQKNIQAYTTQARAAGIPEDQIQANVQLAYTGSLTPGLTTDEKNLNQEIRNYQADPANKGKTREQMIAEHPELAGPADYSAFHAERGKQGQEIGKEKADTKIALPTTLAQIKPIADNIYQMFGPDGKVRPEVITAIQSADLPSEGTAGSIAGTIGGYIGGSPFTPAGLDPKIAGEKNRLFQLQQQLTGNSLATMKNVRNRTEFTTLGQAASSVFKKNQSAADIEAAAEVLRDKYKLAEANAIAAGGGEIPADMADKVDPEYLKTDGKPGTLYNGATIARPLAEASAPKSVAPPVEGAKQAADGNWYVPDPKRPGKYLRVN